MWLGEVPLRFWMILSQVFTHRDINCVDIHTPMHTYALFHFRKMYPEFEFPVCMSVCVWVYVPVCANTH